MNHLYRDKIYPQITVSSPQKLCKLSLDCSFIQNKECYVAIFISFCTAGGGGLLSYKSYY